MFSTRRCLRYLKHMRWWKRCAFGLIGFLLVIYTRKRVRAYNERVMSWQVEDHGQGIAVNDDSVTAYIARYLDIKFNVGIDSAEGPEIWMTNTGNYSIRGGNWRIYYNHYTTYRRSHLPVVIPKTTAVIVDQGLFIYHVTGNLFRIKPNQNSFKPLKSGERRILRLGSHNFRPANHLVSKNWYVVVENGTGSTNTPRIIESTSGEDLAFVKAFTESEAKRMLKDDARNRYAKNQLHFKEDELTPGINIIPSPEKIVTRGKKLIYIFLIPSTWSINTEPEYEEEAQYLSKQIKLNIIKETCNTKCIYIRKPSKGNMGDEEYQLIVETTQITMVAQTGNGLFYAIQSLLSLLIKFKDEYRIPVCEIHDKPRFEYRGVHLDVARNFIPKGAVIKLLDIMGTYKLNKFHFHLSDDEGWRLQVPGLPELTDLSSKRCHDPSEKLCLLPQYGSGPFLTSSGTGYYTTEDYKEILQFAKSRHIQVIPEFDLPGHARAALKAMESRQGSAHVDENINYRLSERDDKTVYKTIQNYNDSVANVCIKSTYEFFKYLFGEIKKLHNDSNPLTMYHIGCDEIAKGTWLASPACKNLKNLEHVDDLKVYFVQQIFDLLRHEDVHLGAWEDGFFSRSFNNPLKLKSLKSSDDKRDAVAYVWNTLPFTPNLADRATSLVNEGYKVVVTPANRLYFDIKYESQRGELGNDWSAEAVTARDVFDFQPLNVIDKTKLRPNAFGTGTDPSNNIIGMQGNLWTEMVHNPDEMFYMYFPRLLALAERSWHKASWEETSQFIWTDKMKSDWAEFARTVGNKELKRLDELDVAYRIPLPGVIVERFDRIIYQFIVVGFPLPSVICRSQFPSSDPTRIKESNYVYRKRMKARLQIVMNYKKKYELQNKHLPHDFAYVAWLQVAPNYTKTGKELQSDAPRFTDCFRTTVFEWCPFVWLFSALPCYLLYLIKHGDRTPLPITAFSVVKSFISVILCILTLMQLWTVGRYGYECEEDRPIPGSFYLGVTFRAVSFAVLTIFIQLVRHRGVVSSAVIYIYWIILTVCCIIPLQDCISYHPSCGGCILYYVYFGFVCIQLLLHSFADKRSAFDYQHLGSEKPECPENDSSSLSVFTFMWFFSTVIEAYKKKLGPENLWEQTERLKSENVVKEVKKAWSKQQEQIDKEARKNQKLLRRQVRRSRSFTLSDETPLLSRKEKQAGSINDQSRRQPSLYTALTKTHWFFFLKGLLVKLSCDILIFLQPLVLRLIIGFIENKGTSNDPEWTGYGLAVVFFLIGFLESFLFHQSAHLMMTMGLKIKSSLIGMIYEKSLRMSNAAKQDYTVGEIVNLMSVDCQRIQDAFIFLYFGVTFFTSVAIALWVIWEYIGIATVGALVIVIIFAALNIFFGRIQERYQQQLLRYKGNRIRLVNEVMGGIKVLKMFGWEPTFTENILDIRNKEMHILKKIAVVSAFSILLAVHSPFFMTCAIFFVYIIINTSVHLDAQTVFLVLSVVNILRFPVALLPFVITGVIQAYVSIGRIQQFLLGEDLDPNCVRFSDTADYAVSIDHGRFTWDREQPTPTLSNINLNITDGSLVAIVGPVGAGKSSLINAVLGEMECLQGEITVKGSLAYVPQEAWIQNKTLRDNILYGKPYRERKYNKILNACALIPDLEILSAGDQTEIGMKGINLSGGQKQRVSLARAVYNNADIYLFDDPLSAVDAHVGKDIFKNVLSNRDGLLRNKTRVLVTHGVHWLPNVDRIFVMYNGQITEQGTYEELIQHNGAFAQFLQAYLMTDDGVDDKSDAEIESIKNKMRGHIENVTSDGFTSDDNLFEEFSARQRKGTRTESTISDMFYTSGNVSGIVRSMSQTEDNVQVSIGQLIQEETLSEGAVSFGVVKSLIKNIGTLASFIAFICLAAFQGVSIYSNYWLTDWSEDSYLANISLSSTEEYSDTNIYYIIVYTILGVIQGIALLSFGLIALIRMVVATGSLHRNMLHSIMKSPMSFFDTTPIGRLINRFSSDIDVMDDRLPRTFRLWSVMLMTLVSTIIVVTIQTPIFVVALIPVGVIYFLLLRLYLPTARQVKRIESVTRSPVYNHFSETITGASVIRAFKSQRSFIQESQKRVDLNCVFFYAANVSARWISVAVEFLSNLLVLAAAIFSLTSTDLNGGDVGLSLTYALQIVYALNLVGQSVSEMEMNMVSAERVVEYTELDSEAEWIIPSFRPPSSWPHEGKIKFLNYATRYRPGLDLVLRGINCDIRSGEKIGIVGRTGAGKSSLTVSLFRLIESAGGSITIDGIRIADIGLHDLRPRITILPQDPVIFSGSLKSNVDPLGRFEDSDIWKALEAAHLKSYIQNQREQLMYECGEGGQNLSVGQRQLVCLGRALLHKNKILILDEATAAVDMETDELIQQTIRKDFADCTVVTIAHRLNTILDYDRVIVMDKGLIIECDTPKQLLQNPSTVFHGMARDADLLNWFDR